MAASLQTRTNVRLPTALDATRALLRATEPLSPQLAAGLAESLWLRPRRHTRPRREVGWLQTALRERVSFGMGHLAAWSWGDGPTVLLVHGWEGRGSQLAGLAEPLVARGCRVLAFDAPGHGDSPGRRSSLPLFAEAITAAARHEGGLHGIVAHSMGAAAAIVALRTLRVERVALLAPVDAGEAIRRFGGFMGLSDAAQGHLERRVEERFGRPIADFSGPRLSREMDADLLVIHDRADVFVPWGDGAAIAGSWPDGRLQSTDGLGHHRILRDPDVIAEVARFVGR